MENSNCADYITEKLGAAIISGTVPVVFSVDGIPNYDRYLPEHSYINAADFSSAKSMFVVDVSNIYLTLFMVDALYRSCRLLAVCRWK